MGWLLQELEELSIHPANRQPDDTEMSMRLPLCRRIAKLLSTKKRHDVDVPASISVCGCSGNKKKHQMRRRHDVGQISVDWRARKIN